jgi:hypothetical protein
MGLKPMSVDKENTSGPFGVITLAVTAKDELRLFVEICVEGGFAYAQNAKRIVEILNRSKDRENDPVFKSKMKRAESLEEFAKVQGESEFSYLYCLVSLRLWSILETFVKDLSREMLLAFPELQSIESLSQLTGPLLPFLMCSQSEQAAIILELLESKLRGMKKEIGIARFESRLEHFDLRGTVNPIVKRTLLELWAVRNVVAHRNGVADSRFMESCPWFGASLGKQIVISDRQFRRYDLASFWYILEVYRRLAVKFPQHVPAVDEGFVEVSEAEDSLKFIVERLGEEEKGRTVK